MYRYTQEAVQCRDLINQIINYLQDEYMATKAARVHCWTGGCLVQKGVDCTDECFQWIMMEREEFGDLARRFRLASFEEGWYKIPGGN